MNAIVLDTVKTGLRNSRMDRIGSLARSSTATKAASSATPAAARPRMVAEVQAYSCPPQTVTSSRDDTPATMSAAPSQSMLCSSRRWAAGLSTTAVAISARMPIGTLT
jgi:hypothetical protein